MLVVALSQDMLPEEIPALRKLVEKTLADKGIDLTAGPVGRIGLDPSNSVGRAFNVEGFPSVVILDAQGDRPIGLRRLPLRHRRFPASSRWPGRSTRLLAGK